MSSDKSTPTSGKSNGDAPATPKSPRSYAAVLRGDPETPPTTAASSSATSPLTKAQKILAAVRMVNAPAASQADSSVASSPTTAPLMSTVSMALCAESTDLRAGWEAMKAKMALEGQEVPPTTVPIPLRRREAAPSMPMPTAPQPEAQRSPSPVVTSPIRAPAPSSSALPSSLGAVSHLDLCAMAEGVFRGTHRALYGVLAEEAPAASIAAASPIGPPAASSSPIPSPAAPSRRLPVQAPTYEVPPAWYADLEPLGWEVSASKTPSPKPVNSKPASPKPVSSEESIPSDDANDLEQPDSSGNATTDSIATPPKTPETSGQADIRVLHDEVNAAKNILKKHKREFIELEGTPEKPILDESEPRQSSGSFDDPPWFAKATYRTPTPSKNAETPEDAPKRRRLIESDDDAESDEEDVSDGASPANDAEEAPKPAPSTPRSPAKRLRTPTPERAESPVVRPVLIATRRRRRIRSAPESTVAPLITVQMRHQWMMQTKHRCPDCNQDCRFFNPVNPIPDSDEEMTPPASPRSERTPTPEAINDVAPMDDMDFEDAEDAVANVAGAATPEANVAGAALPVDFEMPPLEPYSPPTSPVRRSTSRSISQMSNAAGSVSDVSLAMPSRPASPIRDNFCPRCHRDCNCPHVENPNVEFAPAPVRRRGPRRVTTEEAWARMATVTDIIGVDLPAPEPVIRDEPWMVIDNGPLTADRQVQTIRRPTFQLVLYDSGIVVLRGHFHGVSLNSKLLALAAKQPTVIFNDPEDPADQIAAGYNHIVVRTQLGRLFTFGRGLEGQLGATKKPRRIRQATANLASMRRFVPDDADLVFTDIKASGNWTKAKAENGKWYACGEGHKTVLTKVVRRIRE